MQNALSTFAFAEKVGISMAVISRIIAIDSIFDSLFDRIQVNAVIKQTDIH